VELAIPSTPSAEIGVMLLAVKLPKDSSSLILALRLSTLLSSDARSSSTSLSYFAERMSHSLANL
jgi:hypothetical protein